MPWNRELFARLPSRRVACPLTHDRVRPPSEFIPPVQEPYQYIIFRASEVKDLAVDEPAPLRSVHDDPAVLGVSEHVAKYLKQTINIHNYRHLLQELNPHMVHTVLHTSNLA